MAAAPKQKGGRPKGGRGHRPGADGLTALEREFVRHYVETGNASESYKRAGAGSPNDLTARKRGFEILHRPAVQAAVTKLHEAAAVVAVQKTGLDKAWVMERLELVVNRCLSDREFNPSGANKALELIGKENGMFRERVEHSGDAAAPIVHEVRRIIVDPSRNSNS